MVFFFFFNQSLIFRGEIKTKQEIANLRQICIISKIYLLILIQNLNSNIILVELKLDFSFCLNCWPAGNSLYMWGIAALVI
jgi:hypothetical protein